MDPFLQFLSRCAASIGLALAASAQEPAPPTPPAATPPEPQLVAGALPEAASAEARALWASLCDATAPAAQGGAPQPKVRAFDLLFDGTLQSGGKRSNDFKTRYLYLEPDSVRMSLESGRERLRGPRGDYVIESGRSVRIQGREMAEDLRELNETVAIAKCFVGLTDPRSLRLQSLELMREPARGLPAAVQGRNPASLEWISITSPDLERARAGSGSKAVWRAQIGLDSKSHLPALALVAEDNHGTLVLETAMLVELDKYNALDGFRVPGQIKTYVPDTERSPWVFSERPSMKLWLVKGTLRPELDEKSFVPR